MTLICGVRNTSNEGKLGTGLFSDIEDALLAEFNQVQLQKYENNSDLVAVSPHMDMSVG